MSGEEDLPLPAPPLDLDDEPLSVQEYVRAALRSSPRIPWEMLEEKVP